jgi:hypothetical protein
MAQVMYARKRAHSIGSTSANHLQRPPLIPCWNITDNEQRGYAGSG